MQPCAYVASRPSDTEQKPHGGPPWGFVVLRPGTTEPRLLARSGQECRERGVGGGERRAIVGGAAGEEFLRAGAIDQLLEPATHRGRPTGRDRLEAARHPVGVLVVPALVADGRD